MSITMKGLVLHKLLVRSVAIKVLLLLVSIYGNTQTRVFIIDLDTPHVRNDFSYTHFKMATSPLYGVDGSIELFNLFPSSIRHNSELILFSILPDLSGKDDWADLNSLGAYREVSFQELLRMKDKNLSITYEDPYFTRYGNEIRLGVRQEGQVKVANMCLLQFFAIRNYPEVLNRPLGTIDTGQRTVSIKQFQLEYEQHYPGDSFPLLPGQGVSISFEPLRMKREFLSRRFTYNGEPAYQFWTFYDWSTRDGYEIERGIDRFVYVPGKGIVGGSFDFYFYFHRQQLGLPYALFRDNILQEKVMLAEELK